MSVFKINQKHKCNFANRKETTTPANKIVVHFVTHFTPYKDINQLLISLVLHSSRSLKELFCLFFAVLNECMWKEMFLQSETILYQLLKVFKLLPKLSDFI
jgi:hypothetical protein